MNNQDTFIEINGLFVANYPTIDNRIYTLDTLKNIENQINTQNEKISIQEMYCKERTKYNIPLYEPIKNRSMADILFATINNESLNILCKIKNNKYGKKLINIINEFGINNIDFIPVGFGNIKQNNKQLIEVYNYTLKYVNIDKKVKYDK